MASKKKILVVTPRFPFPEAGACEQDRAEGIRQLQRLGFEVRVISKVFDWQKTEVITALWEKAGVGVTLVPYVYGSRLAPKRWPKYAYVLSHPWYLDGSVLEYTEPQIRAALRRALDEFKPDYVWFDYTYLWPLYGLVKKQGRPIMVRSINFEGRHFLEEDGRSFFNYLKYLPKYLTEVITGRRADVVFAITPLEQKLYERAGAKRVVNLPLRALYQKLGTHTPRPADQLHIFFSGSTYNVTHNRRALEFIINDLAPRVYQAQGNKFRFHVTGAKFPEELRGALVDNVSDEGFIEEWEPFLRQMDIALAPSFYGAGMQQKIFEPLARGFPVITHARGLAGYDFVPGEDVLTGETVADFITALKALQSLELRQRLSANCKIKSRAQFNREAVDGIVQAVLLNKIT